MGDYLFNMGFSFFGWVGYLLKIFDHRRLFSVGFRFVFSVFSITCFRSFWIIEPCEGAIVFSGVLRRGER